MLEFLEPVPGISQGSTTAPAHGANRTATPADVCHNMTVMGVHAFSYLV
jgi:hypothetical protein